MIGNIIIILLLIVAVVVSEIAWFQSVPVLKFNFKTHQSGISIYSKYQAETISCFHNREDTTLQPT